MRRANARDRPARSVTHPAWVMLSVHLALVSSASALASGRSAETSERALVEYRSKKAWEALWKASPFSGAPFLAPQEIAALPTMEQDGQNTNMNVFRLLPNKVNTKGASECNSGNQAGKDACLYKQDRECMWAKIESKDPMKAIQEAYSYCLPCVIDEQPIPCWNVGAVVGGYYTVMDCQMRCPHQQRIIQPEYGCAEESGFITNSQCFDRGARSQSKCMFMAYTLEDGSKKSVCGPCYVSGTGGYGCPNTGGAGPEAGSTLNFCLEQCSTLCMGPPDCAPTVAPPPPPPPPSPGIIKTATDPDTMLLAPVPIGIPTVSPYAFALAAQKAAEAAGWEIGTPIPPAQYHPVIMYRAPSDYLNTPAPGGGIPTNLAYPAPGLMQMGNVAMTTDGPSSESMAAFMQRGVPVQGPTYDADGDDVDNTHVPRLASVNLRAQTDAAFAAIDQQAQ